MSVRHESSISRDGRPIPVNVMIQVWPDQNDLSKLPKEPTVDDLFLGPHFFSSCSFSDQRWIIRARDLPRNEVITVFGQIAFVDPRGISLDNCEIIE